MQKGIVARRSLDAKAAPASAYASRLTGTGEGFQLRDHPVQLVDQRMVPRFAKRGDKRAIIPERARLLSGEPFEHAFAMHPQIVEHLARIRELVRGGHQSHIFGFTGQALEIGALSFQPRRLRFRVGIGAAVNNASHTLAEFSADFPKAGHSALVFHGVMKQRRNGHVFAAAVFNHDRADAQEMPNVRPLGPFANLAAMQPRGISQGLDKPAREDSSWKVFGDGTDFP